MQNNVALLGNLLNESEKKKLLNFADEPANDLYNQPWISPVLDRYGKVRTHIVNPAILAEHLKNSTNYIFAFDENSQALIKYFYHQDGYYKKMTDTQLKGIIKKFIPLDIQKVRDIDDVLKLWEMSAEYVSICKLNADENIINFKNGVLLLNKKQLIPHDPKYKSTIQIPVNYIPNMIMKDSVFDDYMKTLTAGDNSIEKLIIQFLGAAISNLSGFRFKKALFLCGLGDTGKSCIRRLATKLIGAENDSSADLSELESRFGKTEVYNRRIVGTADMGFATVSELKLFKKLTGGDSVSVEFKGRPSFNYTYRGLLWFCCNRLPRFGGDDGTWVYNRIVVVNCKNVIPQSMQDADIVEKMFAERDYIVSKAVQGLFDAIQNGYKFSIPSSCQMATDTFREENNSALKFLKACCVPREKIKDSCTTKRLYDVYKEFCRDEDNGFCKPKTEFRQILLAKGISEIKTNGNTYFNVTLSHQAKTDYVKIYGYDSV